MDIKESFESLTGLLLIVFEKDLPGSGPLVDEIASFLESTESVIDTAISDGTYLETLESLKVSLDTYSLKLYKMIEGANNG